MRWGFASAPGEQPTIAPINARAETVAATSLFRDAFRRRRCLVVAHGFYELQRERAAQDSVLRSPAFMSNVRVRGYLDVVSNHGRSADADG